MTDLHSFWVTSFFSLSLFFGRAVSSSRIHVFSACVAHSTEAMDAYLCITPCSSHHVTSILIVHRGRASKVVLTFPWFSTAVAGAARGITERSDACGSSHRMALLRGRCVATSLNCELNLFVHSAVGLNCVLASWIM